MKENVKLEDLRKLKQHFAPLVQDFYGSEGEYVTDNHPALVIARNELSTTLTYAPNFLTMVDMCFEKYKEDNGVECKIEVMKQFGSVRLYDGDRKVYEIICLKANADHKEVMDMDFNKALGPMYQMFK